MSTSTQFAVGDSVSWTHSSSNGSSWRFTTRNGKIVNLANDQALCKMRNGRKYWVLLRRLTRDGEPTELTKAFTEMANQMLVGVRRLHALRNPMLETALFKVMEDRLRMGTENLQASERAPQIEVGPGKG